MYIGRFYIIPYSIAWWIIGLFQCILMVGSLFAMYWLLWALVG